MTGEPRCLGTFVGSNAGFCVSVAMGMRVNSGDGVSAGARVAPGCATVVGSGTRGGTSMTFTAP